MLKHWLIDLIGHVSGLSDAQLRQIEKSVPASKALIDLLIRAQPIIEQAQKLYAEAEPLIDDAMKEWHTIGPAAQILIDVIGHHAHHADECCLVSNESRIPEDGLHHSGPNKYRLRTPNRSHRSSPCILM